MGQGIIAVIAWALILAVPILAIGSLIYWVLRAIFFPDSFPYSDY